MRRQTIRAVEFGGRHSGTVSYVPTSNTLVLDRQEIAYVLHALRRGTDSDKVFTQKMFHVLIPTVRCASCGRRIMKEHSKTFHERILCRECNAALEDIEYCLIQSRCFPRPGKHPLEELAPIQRGRASWCPAHINYLVTRTRMKCIWRNSMH